MKYIDTIREKVPLLEVLLWLTFFHALVVASPFVVRQFHRLETAEGAVKVGDVIWNVAFDFMVFNIVILAFVLLVKLIRKANSWLDKNNR